MDEKIENDMENNYLEGLGLSLDTATSLARSLLGVILRALGLYLTI